jgi:hypothetical protein
MKRPVHYLFIANVLLVIVLIILIDPFSFYPKSYEDAPLYFSGNTDEVSSIVLEMKRLDAVDQLTFIKEQDGWFLFDKMQNSKWIAEHQKISKVIGDISKIHFYEKDKKIIQDDGFLGEVSLAIRLHENSGQDYDLEFGKCFQPKSECLVREKNSRITYTIPFSIYEAINDLSIENFLTKAPFSNLTENQITKIAYTWNGNLKYTLFKEKEEWKTFPEFDGEIEKKSLNDFMLRLTAWTGDAVLINERISKTQNSSSFIQSISVDYTTLLGEMKNITAIDVGNIGPNKKIILVKPFNQLVLMSNYSWEYWRFFDIKQLSKVID